MARLAEDFHTLIVEDLTPTLGSGRRLPPPIGAFAGPDRVVTIGSLSKAGWGGLRIGWLRADRRLVMRLAAAKAVDDQGSSILSQAVAVRILADATSLAERAERESLHRREVALEALRERLPDWSVAAPRGGLSLWVRRRMATGSRSQEWPQGRASSSGLDRSRRRRVASATMSGWRWARSQVGWWRVSGGSRSRGRSTRAVAARRSGPQRSASDHQWVVAVRRRPLC